ncbi:MAG: hypothetical protein G01um10143_374 [Parcubacteria group bacterium Gr01-1014_3]|nr:MAG: hypothetical protein G01um10143_374 [Parcubacteria group bacterium Gr01-1014_3]
MELYGTPLSAEKLIEKLNEGGWIVSGGHRVRGASFPNFPVIKAHLLGDEPKLMIETHKGNFEVPSDRIAIINPYTAVIRHTFMRKEQRKKIDGGGWREVPAVGVALEVSYPKIRKDFQKAQEENARLQDRRSQRAKVTAETRRANKLKKSRQEFAAKLCSKFGGKTIAPDGIDLIENGVEGIELKFTDGTKISIELDGGDTWDAWIMVNKNDLSKFYFR